MSFQFFGTPKGLLILILLVFAALAAPFEGLRAALPGLLSAIVAASAVDAVILRVRKRWEFPSGAILTAMIVAMVLRAQEHWYVVSITAVAAVLSKYLVRSKTANVFNPAALAVVASFFVFHTGQSWWGALPEVKPVFLQLTLMAGGIFITDRVNKMPLVLVFLGTYFLLFTVAAFAGNPQHVSEIFRAPDLHAVLFFAFVILTDPPTSPAKHPDQIVCGAIVAAVSFAVFQWLGAVYYLLAGVLAGNVWEAWRRVHRRAKHRFPRGTVAFVKEILLPRQSVIRKLSP